MRFAHIADVHLGGWKQPELQQLNFQSFQKAIEICIKEKLDFVLIVGDLFDSAYPPIEILKETFAEFRKLKDAKIPCFIVAGSHDYSASGKTFLDVLEKAGFCKNVCDVEEKEDKIILNPVLHQGFAIYGYPGKKAGMEIEDLRKLKINDCPGMFKIFMLHTTLDKAKGNLPIDAISTEELPKMDYYALGHLHIDFQYENFVYPGPIFPNNFQELEDLNYGSFYIVDVENNKTKMNKVELKIREVVSVEVNLSDATMATEKVINEISRKNINEKIILLRLRGKLENGTNSDIKFKQIEDFVRSRGAYSILRNTHELETKEAELEIEVKESENVEGETIKVYTEENPADFNRLIPELMNILSIEKQEGEKTEVFNNRLIEGSKKLLEFG